MHVSDALAETLVRLPSESGVYLFKDLQGKVLYVGKATSLRARVRSYFSGGDTRYQIPTLLKLVTDVEVLVTATVKEALLLVAKRYDVLAFDLTEVDPVYDPAGVTPRIAAKLLLDFLGGVFGK